MNTCEFDADGEACDTTADRARVVCSGDSGGGAVAFEIWVRRHNDPDNDAFHQDETFTFDEPIAVHYGVDTTFRIDLSGSTDPDTICEVEHE